MNRVGSWLTCRRSRTLTVVSEISEVAVNSSIASNWGCIMLSPVLREVTENTLTKT